MRPLLGVARQRHRVPSSSASPLTSSASPLTSPTSSRSLHTQVLFDAHDANRLITLNRPAQLNSVTYRMILALRENLTKFEHDPSVGLVVIKGAGERAFSAGGDVTELRQGAIDDDHVLKNFVYDEYTTDYLTATYRKPYIALIDGVTMGAGVGLSCHSRYRVCTEHTQFAMPETSIGLFPDVGAGYLLSRMRSRLGMWLALSSHSMLGVDVKRYGIATHFCQRKLLPELERTLLAVPLKHCLNEKVEEILDDFDARSVKPETNISQETKEIIAECFSADTVEEAIELLQQNDTTFTKATVDALRQKSPMSLKITHEQISRAKTMPLHEVFTMDYRIVRRMIYATGSPDGSDFVEGFVDKTHTPVWSPSTLSDISRETVLAHFRPLEYPHRELYLRVM